MSTSSIETFTTLAVAGVALLYGYSVYNRASTSPAATQNTQPASADESQNTAPGKKNKKKKKGASSSAAPTPGNATPVVSLPEAIPGSLSLEDISVNVSPQTQPPDTTVGIDAVPPSDKAKKQKKKKAAKKAAPALAASSSALDTDFAIPQEPSGSTNTQSQRKRRDSSPHDGQTDASWIHVGSTKKSARKGKAKDQQTEVESNKSDVSESTPNETPASDQEKPKDNVRTLAEKILPKPRKTKVDDMLETPDQPTLARVMRVQSGTVGTPSESLSRADYEDGGATDVAGVDADADGEGDDDDEGGWGVVKSRKPRYTRPAEATASAISSSQSSISGASSSLSQTKRQRQNAKRREEAKATKAQEEEARLARLTQHKRQLEQERIRAQYASGGSANKGKLSGGMRASVDAAGHIVWES